MLLLRSAVARRTVDGAAFVAPQFWKHINGLIWWDLNYLHNDLRVRGALSPTLKRRHWLQWFSQKIQMETPGDEQHIHLTETLQDTNPMTLKANVCTTLGAYIFFGGPWTFAPADAPRIAPGAALV